MKGFVQDLNFFVCGLGKNVVFIDVLNLYIINPHERHRDQCVFTEKIYSY